MRILTLLIAITMSLAGCSPSDQPATDSDGGPVVDAADTVFTNGRIYTVNPDQEWAEAVAVRDNKIVYVGDAAGATAYVGDGTETIDLDGKMLLPGFVSGHDHLIAARWVAYGADLSAAKSKEEYLEIIKEWAEANPDEKIVRGAGWNPAIYGGDPMAADLDTVVSDRPALLLDFTIHDAWLNTKALEDGGVTKDTPDSIPGVTFWVRDAAGNPTGRSNEFAWMPTFIDLGAWQPETAIPASQKVLQQAAIEAGITTALTPAIVTPNVNAGMAYLDDFERIMDLMAELDRNGELKLRTFTQPGYKNPSADPEEFAAAAAELARKYDTDRLRVSGIKIHPEGNWSSKTSLMLAPYLPDDGSPDLLDRPSPASFGAASVSGELMEAVVLAANAKGLDVNTHVDGSQTVRNMIDAIAASRNAGYTDARNQLSHLFWAHPDDLQRIFDMDITVNVTPNFSTDWSSQDVIARELLGEERIQEQLTKYPDVVRNGNKVSISADIPSAPIEHIGPLFQIETAMTIQDPTNPDSKVFPEGREGLTLEQAIAAVTINPAWQMRMEDKIGSLEVGKYADFVVLDQNLFDVAPRDITNVKVLATMMDGEFTHRDGI